MTQLTRPNLNAEKITRPIQLVAAWFVTLVILVGAFLGAASINQPPVWLPVLFGIAAVVAVPLFTYFVYRLQTKYRPELQEDVYYSKYRSDDKRLAGFEPENTLLVADSASPTAKNIALSADLREYRSNLIDENHSIFLVHTWRPTEKKGQVAEISIQLRERRKTSQRLLADNKIASVEYYLGSLFFYGETRKKTNSGDYFRLDVAAYGSPLCVAKVNLKDGSTPIFLYRFCDIGD